VSVLRKGVSGFSLTAVVGSRLFLLAALVMLVATGCSSRKRKSRPSGSLTIATTSLPDATEGVTYSYTVTASGGNSANYNWSISGQPSWLTIDSATGELSGTPPAGSAGTYTFTVTVDDGQQTANKQFDLVVKSGGGGRTLSADFEANPTQGKAALTVAFTDKSTGNPTSWEWDFDNDGTVDSTQQNPTYTYSNPGWYTVKLTVSDGTDTDTCVREMYVLVAGRIYYVDGVNGDDANGGTGWNDAFATIGKALSVAGDYDLVLVADATYNETDLNFNGKKIYLKGVDHNTSGAQPEIDCQSNGRAFYFGSGETKDSVIDNVTIQNGRVEDTGGGAVLCENSSSPTIRNCVFENNEVADTNGMNDGEEGGAIFCDNSSPTITNCTFSDNGVDLHGGAVSCSSGSPSIINCTFSGNSGKYGGMIYCYNSSSPTLNNCILWSNTASTSGNEIHIEDPSSSCTLNYCCVDNTGYGGGTGNIDDSNNCIFVDPQFVDAANGDYHLKPASPCIDTGSNAYISGVATDLDGKQRIVDGDGDGTATVDIGAYEFCNIMYVDGTSGDDTNDGISWGEAKKTIQGGIDAASDWWLVLVADGTYTGAGNKNIDFGGKKIYLKGVDHNNAGQRPVIDCQSSGRAFYFHLGETEDSVLDNFTIKNGSILAGGAIWCKNSSSPTITNCTFSNNSANDWGGAIFCWHCSSPTITNCTFIGNSAKWGGAIGCLTFNWPTITNCIFIDNSAADDGGAIDCVDSGPNIINCTFSGNSAKGNGGAIYCGSSSGPGSGSSPTLDNCVFWGNSAGNGANEICICDSGSSCTLNYCCVDNTGYGGQTGNITENNCIHQEPQFVDPANGDYHLKDTSPCIDAGDNSSVPSSVTTDLDGNQRIADGDNDGTATVDIGAYEYQP